MPSGHFGVASLRELTSLKHFPPSLRCQLPTPRNSLLAVKANTGQSRSVPALFNGGRQGPWEPGGYGRALRCVTAHRKKTPAVIEVSLEHLKKHKIAVLSAASANRFITTTLHRPRCTNHATFSRG